MSIYPERDRHSELTGKFKVELTLKGKRLRGLATSIEQAREMEEGFRYSLSRSEGLTRSFDKRNAPKTLGELYEKANDPLWRNNRTAEQSQARCKEACRIIGNHKLLESLCTEDIDALAEALLEDKSPATVNRYLSAIHTLLKYAEDREYISRLPKFSWHTETSGRIRWITEEEEEVLYTLVPPQIAKLIKVALATGMRRDEILTLEKHNVEPQWVRLWKTKNGTARSIPINEVTYGLLKDLLLSMPTRDKLRDAWDAARVKMGLKDDRQFVFHATRHTCATRLVRANVNIRVVQEWMGHKEIKTTLRYAHVHDNMLLQALSSVETHKDVATVGQRPVSPALSMNQERIPTETT